ncbi:MAG: VCBS repeat-containing protein, partial [Planctomycetota bacterium]
MLILLASVVALILTGVVILLSMPADDNGGGVGGGGENVEERSSENQSVPPLKLVSLALDESEALRVAEAESVYQQILADYPDDVPTLQNAALNMVLSLRMGKAVMDNTMESAEVKSETRRQMGRDILRARELVKQFQNAATGKQDRKDNSISDATLVDWMTARIDQYEVELLPRLIREDTRNEAWERLMVSIEANPAQEILVGTLVDMTNAYRDRNQDYRLSGEIGKRYLAAMRAVSDANPRNLYIATEVLGDAVLLEDLNSTTKMAVLSRKLASPVEPLTRRNTEILGKSPDELTEAIVDAGMRGDWESAFIDKNYWFNALNSTSLMKSERRRVAPHPLDLLDLSLLRDAAIAASNNADVKTPDVSTNVLEFQFTSLPATGTAVDVAAVDFDLTGNLEIAVVDETHVRMFQQSNSNDNPGDYQEFASTDFSSFVSKPRGVIAVDLFMVDVTSSERIKRPMKDIDGGDAARFAADKMQDTFASLMVYGDRILMLRMDGRRDTADADRLIPVTKETGLESIRDVLCITPGDFDADGDLDLAIATRGGGVQLMINRGNTTFFPVTRHSELPAAENPVLSMTIADVDRDLDLDLVTTHADGRVGWMENLLHLQFRHAYMDAGASASPDALTSNPHATSVFVGEIDGNVSWDIVMGTREGALVTLTNTPDAGVWSIPKPAGEKKVDSPLANLVAADFDNDSWLEFITPDADGLRLESLGPWGSRQTGTLRSELLGTSPRRFRAADL